MFCPNCGKEVDKNAYACLNCGVKLANDEVNNIEDKNSVGLNILGFLFPIIGLILYLSYKNKTPIKAKNIGICALVGFVIGFIFNMITLS